MCAEILGDDRAAILARADMVVQCQLKLILRPSQERTLERWLWRQVLATAAGWVGYTHAWRTCDARFKTILMASVDDPREFFQAGLTGWRTFRVRRPHEDLIAGAEFICPASDEAGHRTTCSRCQLCRGQASPARSVAILVHGKPSNLKAFGLPMLSRGRAFGRPAKSSPPLQEVRNESVR